MESVFSTSSLMFFALSTTIWLTYALLALGAVRLRGGGSGQNRAQHLRMLYFTSALAIQAALFAPSPLLARLRAGANHSASSANNSVRERQDLFVLALQWTPGVCYRGVDFRNRRCHNCLRNNWTIHGLWGMMSFCGEYETFSKLSLNVKLMQALWPSCGRPDEEFWEYEWRKHGTCFREISGVNSMTKYFNKTLYLTERANILNILAEQDIRPSSTYTVSVEAIEKALQKIHGASATVNCDNPRYGKSLLTEIHICFDGSFRPSNCRPVRQRCRSQVFYEEFPRSTDYYE